MAKNHIVTTIHPFVMEQEVSVYQNGECSKSVNCTLNELADVIIGLSKEFNIKTVDLAGSNQLFSLKTKDDLMSKYAENDLEIIVH